MKLAQIGTVGHYAYALPTAKKYGIDFCGIAAADENDDIAHALSEIRTCGFAPKVYDKYEEMIQNEAPDIVIVNTVMGKNAEIAAYTLRRGISVFCEKPTGTDFTSLATLEKAYYEAKARFAGTKSVCFCGMFGIDYLPHFETAYRYVKAGKLGDIRLANGQKSYKLGRREPFYSDRKKYGGTIPWVAIHAMEWILRIGGLRPISVSALADTACNGGNGTMEVSTLCLMNCEDGKMASVSADVMRPSGAPTHDDDRIRFVGSGGILEVRGGRVFVIGGEGERELPLVRAEKELFEEFLMEIRGEGLCRVRAEDAFLATRTALAARMAADTGKTVVLSEIQTV